jgi:hypothetical protein
MKPAPYPDPNSISLAFTQDPAFTFDERRHLYHYDGQPLDSVSTVRKALSVPFDKHRIAGYVARKRGVTKTTVLAEWEYKRDRASIRGTLVHDAIEAFLGSGVMPNVPEAHGLEPDELWDVVLRLQRFQNWATTNLRGLRVLGTEVRVYSLTLRMAGTLDTLCWRDGYLYVGDWKTNATFGTGTPGEKVYENLLPPLAHLPDVALTTYSAQVSLYRLMLAEHGVRTAGGFIVHVPEDGDPVLHPALDLRRELWEWRQGQSG